MTNSGNAGLTRRGLMTGLAGACLGPSVPAWTSPAARQAVLLQAAPGSAALREAGAETPIWSLVGPTADPVMRFRRGDEIDVTLENRLPIPLLTNWHGIDGAAETEPLVRPPLQPGAKDGWTVALRHAGSFMCDLRLLGDGQQRPLPVRPVIVAESEPVPVDRDEVLLIEDWRLGPDGSPIAPGSDPGAAAALYTVNGRSSAELTLIRHQRLRLRLVNGCHRSVIALKIDDHAVLVMAIDGQPAEPFLARDGALVLAPGTRIDAFIDAVRPAGSVSSIVLHDGAQPHPIGRLLTSNEAPARGAPLPAAGPLPSNGLPAEIELKGATRFELTLGALAGAEPDWVPPAKLTASIAPAFRVKAGRIAVLALRNRAQRPMVFHLHGHHFRLLDRLDDGWKPFWLDTVVIDAGQTQRIAFAAEYSGRWLMEATATDWAAPRLVRCYSVE